MITIETIFSIFNTAVLPVWLLMIVAPYWKWTKLLINTYILPLVLAVVYVVIVFSNISAITEADFGSLKGVQALFVGAGNNAPFATAAWFHYLAFDLFVGTWILNDSQSAKINHFLVIPCLFFTFMLGPTGFLMYWIVKQVNKMIVGSR